MNEAQRRAQTGNRSSSLQSYELVTNEDFLQTSAILYGTSSKASQRRNWESKVSCEQNIEIRTDPSKKMKIDFNGNTNTISVTFE